MRSLRKRLLKVPLDYYRQLKADVDETEAASPESRAGLAKAIAGLAWITASLDSQANAIKSYQQAVDLLDPLVRNDPERQVLLGRVLDELGMLQRAAGSVDAARASLSRAREIQERLTRDHPTSAAYQFDLARTLDRLGLLLFTNEPNESLDCFKQALGIQRRLIGSDAHSATAGARADMALTHNHIGMLKRATGHQDEAGDSFKQAIEILQAVARENPGEPMYRMNLAASHYNLGRQGMDLACFERAREIQDALSARTSCGRVLQSVFGTDVWEPR